LNKFCAKNVYFAQKTFFVQLLHKIYFFCATLAQNIKVNFKGAIKFIKSRQAKQRKLS